MAAISRVSLGDQQMLLICASEGNSQIEQTKITGSKQVSSSINSYYSPPKVFLHISCYPLRDLVIR